MANQSKLINKAKIKEILGSLPMTAELYWFLRRQGEPVEGGFSLKELQADLPAWRDQVQAASQQAASQPGTSPAKKIALFGMRSYWIRYQAAVGLTLAGLGHKPTLIYLPFHKPERLESVFDMRRQNLYIQDILKLAEPVLQSETIQTMFPAKNSPLPELPGSLAADMQDLAFRDVQYIQMQERVSRDSELYRLRLQRDTNACAATLAWLNANKPDVLVVPNAAILEYEAVHRAARFLGIHTSTFELSHLHGKIWLAQDSVVMDQDTSALWAAHGNQPLTAAQWEELRTFYASRKGPEDMKRFVFHYQGTAAQGGVKLRQTLGLDSRPVVLLATNVVGDSLTLGRQAFSADMTSWLEKTIEYFARRPDLQLVVRIHPGELIVKSPSVADIAHQTIQALLPSLPAYPDHVHIIAADDKTTNTYDLMDAADLGLVYTTTAGLEMAMTGKPVMVNGKTHYRDKGFTVDPGSWEEYFAFLDKLPGSVGDIQLTRSQVDLAWNYAYRYFLEYPLPFPWHLYSFKEDAAEWSVGRVLSTEGLDKFGATFRYIAGDEPIRYL